MFIQNGFGNCFTKCLAGFSKSTEQNSMEDQRATQATTQTVDPPNSTTIVQEKRLNGNSSSTLKPPWVEESNCKSGCKCCDTLNRGIYDIPVITMDQII